MGIRPAQKDDFLKGRVFQLSQPYVFSTGFPKETPQAFSVASSRMNKGGYFGCTSEQIWVGNVFVLDFLEI